MRNYRNNSTELSSSTSHKDQPKRRWKREEVDRLKIAVRAGRPESEEDWRNIAIAINKTPAECIQKALRIPRLRPPPILIEPKMPQPNRGRGRPNKRKFDAMAVADTQQQRDDPTRHFFNSITSKDPDLLSMNLFDFDDSLMVECFSTPPYTPRNQRKPYIAKVISNLDEVNEEKKGD